MSVVVSRRAATSPSSAAPPCSTPSPPTASPSVAAASRPSPCRPTRLTLTSDPAWVADSDVVLVTTKSHDTEAIAAAAEPYLGTETVTISLQNGLHNAGRLRDILPGPVLAGVVTYNVARTAPTTYLQATSGEILIEASQAGVPFARAAGAAGLGVEQRQDIVARAARQAADEPQQRRQRAVRPAAQGAALRPRLPPRPRPVPGGGPVGLRGRGRRPGPPLPAAPSAMVKVLRASDSIFSTVARTALKVQPEARSSMADDLAAGRRDRDRGVPGGRRRPRRPARGADAGQLPHRRAHPRRRGGRPGGPDGLERGRTSSTP